MFRIFRHSFSAATFCLFLCETGVVALTLYVVARLFAWSERMTGMPGARVLAAALVLALLNAVIMFSMGLYEPPHMMNFRRGLPRLLGCLFIGAPLLGLGLATGLLSGETVEGREAVLFTSGTALVCAGILLARLISAPVTRASFSARRILVVGAGKLAAEIEYFMSDRRQAPAQVVGYVPLANERPAVPESRLKSNTGRLIDLARECAVKEIVVALDDRRGTPMQPLLEARMEGMVITSHLAFWERETRRVRLSAFDPSWLVYADGFKLSRATSAALKRLLDVSGSLLALVLTMPTLLLAALAIRLDGPGPIFYVQERIGRFGKPFRIYKFRTMRVDAEGSGAPQWATLEDPRVTRVGSFLRRMRIDELPQLLNVLQGRMSFVGPRPERPFFVESLARDIPFYTERHRVRPGITGWAQINHPYCASLEDARTKLSYDLYYIKNFSFLLDLLIILSTAKAVLLDKGGR